MIILYIILAILLLPVVYNLVFPLKLPALDHYFYPGQIFESKWEGVRQEIIRQEGDKVYTEVTLKPGAQGPPEHLHEGFDESGVVKKGVLTVKLNGEIIELRAGDRLSFPKGIYHAFSNNSTEDVVLGAENDNDSIPVSFAYPLSQFYEFFDKPSRFKMLHFFFKMSLFGDTFDTYVKQSPIKIQKLIKVILKPYARVLGYKLESSKAPTGN